MKKHAYLIIAHNNFKVLQLLIEGLQDERNDIYIHLDRKIDKACIDNIVKKHWITPIVLVDSISVSWGDYTQIEAEMILLRAAVQHGGYQYLHLLSGVDLPVKTQEYIHNFFQQYEGKEFIYFDQGDNNAIARERCRYYYFLQKYLNRKKDGCVNFLEDKLIAIQRKMNVNRCREIQQYLGKGSNWFSITEPMAEFVLSKEKFIRKHFHFTKCADEIFLHTLCNMSPYKANVFQERLDESIPFYTNMRKVDWKRGNPYTFQNEDLEEIASSQYLFARKFSEQISTQKVGQILYRRSEK